MQKYILSIDQSTSATKAVLFNSHGQLVHRVNINHSQFYPKPGWVEHDPEEIYTNTLSAISQILNENEITSDEVAALSISNQRETAVVWDKTNGKPVYNAIVWQCQRGNDICKQLIEDGFEDIIRKKTGLIISPYFSASKIKWILDNVDGARKKAESGKLLFGTMDSWLIWKLTGGRIHATDYSNACRTQLFNIYELKWDKELFDIFHIPYSMTPEVKSSNEIFGYTAIEEGFNRKIPISGVMGDSHAALFGQCCFERGMAKATYGTGSSIMMNTGSQPVESKNGLVTSLAWGFSSKVDYVLEGNINCTGDTIKWLVDDLQLISDSKESGQIARSVEDNGGVYLVPAFVGLSAPYWNSEAKASITGITRGIKKAHIVRAAEESIAYQIRDVLDLMARESNIELKELRVDGGPARDDFLMQFQADMLDIPVARNIIEELSAAGSAYMAGFVCGFWNDKSDIEKMQAYDKIFICKMNNSERDRLYTGWLNAVKRTLTKIP